MTTAYKVLKYAKEGKNSWSDLFVSLVRRRLKPAGNANVGILIKQTNKKNQKQILYTLMSMDGNDQSVLAAASYVVYACVQERIIRLH